MEPFLTLLAFLSTTKHFGWPFKGFTSWLGELFGENKWTVTFCPAWRWGLPSAEVVPVREEGRGRSNKRQASSSLVISWEAGTPLLLNWHRLTTNKEEPDCWGHSDQLSNVPRKGSRRRPGNTWTINERNVFLMRTIKLRSNLLCRRSSWRQALAERIEGYISRDLELNTISFSDWFSFLWATCASFFS